jgi:hypothetical protein
MKCFKLSRLEELLERLGILRDAYLAQFHLLHYVACPGCGGAGVTFLAAARGEWWASWPTCSGCGGVGEVRA